MLLTTEPIGKCSAAAYIGFPSTKKAGTSAREVSNLERIRSMIGRAASVCARKI